MTKLSKYYFYFEKTVIETQLLRQQLQGDTAFDKAETLSRSRLSIKGGRSFTRAREKGGGNEHKGTITYTS